MRWAGYDHLVITGRAKHPAYIWIKNDVVELRDASQTWGTRVSEANEAIKRELGDEEVETGFVEGADRFSELGDDGVLVQTDDEARFHEQQHRHGRDHRGDQQQDPTSHTTSDSERPYGFSAGLLGATVVDLRTVPGPMPVNPDSSPSGSTFRTSDP